MGFFDFLSYHPAYSGMREPARRLNKRYGMLVEPFREEIAGARVLDLGAHDGRWSYAIAEAGASRVVGIEPRGELFAGFDAFPDARVRARVDLIEGEAFAALEALAEAGERFDIVAVFGLFYHVMDHFRLLGLIRTVSPGLVIVDGEFVIARGAVIRLVRERTGKTINAVEQFPGQVRAIKGVPSLRAMEEMSDALDFDLAWQDPAPFAADPAGIQDYFRSEGSRRAVCTLRPR